MRVGRPFLISLLISFSLLLLFLVVSWFRADIFFARGESYADAGYLLSARRSLKEATRLWPWEPAYHRGLAEVLVRIAQNFPENQDVIVPLAVREAGRARSLNPRNLITIKSLISVYYRLSTFDSLYTAQVKSLARRGTELCPTDPTLWYYRSLVLFDDEPKLARMLLARALALRPEYEKARKLQKRIDSL